MDRFDRRVHRPVVRQTQRYKPLSFLLFLVAAASLVVAAFWFAFTSG